MIYQDWVLCFEKKTKKTVKKDPFDLQPGRKIGPHYQVVQILGEGSEGKVYQVVDPETKIYRAAKLYLSSHDPKSKTVTWHAQKLHRLRRCEIVLRYHHKEMIHGGKRSVLCLISDFCGGIPLEKWIAQQKRKRLHPFVALRVLYELVRGLEEVHAFGEYHGDVHSQNILLQQVGVHFDVKLVDFYSWGRANTEKRQQDILDVIAVFHECLGGAKGYRAVGNEFRHICSGLKHGIILKQFPTMSALRLHLDTFEWDAACTKT